MAIERSLKKSRRDPVFEDLDCNFLPVVDDYDEENVAAAVTPNQGDVTRFEDYVEVRPSSIDGLGAFAKKDIPPKKLHCRYAPNAKLILKTPDFDKDPTLQKYSLTATIHGQDYVIDGREDMDHWSVRINSSSSESKCNVKFQEDGSITNDGAIPQDAELLIDYGDVYWTGVFGLGLHEVGRAKKMFQRMETRKQEDKPESFSQIRSQAVNGQAPRGRTLKRHQGRNANGPWVETKRNYLELDDFGKDGCKRAAKGITVSFGLGAYPRGDKDCVGKCLRLLGVDNELSSPYRLNELPALFRNNVQFLKPSKWGFIPDTEWSQPRNLLEQVCKHAKVADKFIFQARTQSTDLYCVVVKHGKTASSEGLWKDLSLDGFKELGIVELISGFKIEHLKHQGLPIFDVFTYYFILFLLNLCFVFASQNKT